MTIFCVGTDHTAAERWTITRALFDLTDAEDVELEHVVQTDPNGPTPRVPHDHAKAIFDGPVATSIGFATDPNAFMDTRATLAARFIHAHRPDSISIIGHSRGAVLAVMIAARLHALDTDAPRNVRLWLLDLVTQTEGVMGGLPRLERSTTSTTHGNVAEAVRVVMEDDASRQPGGVITLFPVEDVWVTGADGAARVDHVHVSEGLTTPKVTLLRMPGTHGTGTQVNPLAKQGTLLPGGDITTHAPGSFWPIGEVCLINALERLRHWNVPLIEHAHRFIGATATEDTYRDNLLAAYAQILTRNVRTVGGRDHLQITINDCSKSRQGAEQKIKPVSGTRRSAALDKYGPDHRSNTFIVNEQHLQLLRDAYPGIADQLARIGENAGVTLTDLEGDHATRDVQRMRRQSGETFNRIVMQDVTVGGRPAYELEELGP